MSEDPESVSAPEVSGITPDRLLHTGGSDRPSAEDLVLASGRDVTPETLEWARRKLADEGRSALDRQLP
ncbi:hypothetical protein DKT74_09660 [Streptomyces sp. ZEA17I]|uniref:hypothetical protein n=1 Tax=Streptomyces sp. ZEA17I TaxID=2202516 RepID=UPI000D7022A3|nr:hypothetical protein [Streptomyces sp. ZEA17I]PWS45289.1 hypothetical protein DKT74_09660 [Streptomyces sp. ZEA17I]